MSGTVAARPQGCPDTAKLDLYEAFLRGLIAEKDDVTLEEMRARLMDEHDRSRWRSQSSRRCFACLANALSTVCCPPSGARSTPSDLPNAPTSSPLLTMSKISRKMLQWKATLPSSLGHSSAGEFVLSTLSAPDRLVRFRSQPAADRDAQPIACGYGSRTDCHQSGLVRCTRRVYGGSNFYPQKPDLAGCRSVPGLPNG